MPICQSGAVSQCAKFVRLKTHTKNSKLAARRLFTTVIFGRPASPALRIHSLASRSAVVRALHSSDKNTATTITNAKPQPETSTKIMVNEHHVKSYEEFTALVEGLETQSKGAPIHVLFSGGKDESGNSWCPYCVTGKCSAVGGINGDETSARTRQNCTSHADAASFLVCCIMCVLRSRFCCFVIFVV